MWLHMNIIILVHGNSLNDFSTGGSDADGNRMEVSHLESADCIPTYTQDTVLALHTRTSRHIVMSQQEDGDTHMYVCTHCRLRI